MLREAYKKLENGDHLTDRELEFLSNHMGVATHLLNDLGPVYQLSYQELHRRLFQVKGYIEERRKNSAKYIKDTE